MRPKGRHGGVWGSLYWIFPENAMEGQNFSGKRSLPWGAEAALWIGTRRGSGAAEEELIGCDAELQQIVQPELECQDAAVASGIQKGILHWPTLGRIPCGAGQAKVLGQAGCTVPRSLPHPLRISQSSAMLHKLDQFSGTHIHFQRKHQIVAAQVTYRKEFP